MKDVAPTYLDIPDEAIAMDHGIDHQREKAQWDEHGLLTNQAFRDTAFHDVKNAQVSGRPISMIISDLDGFKGINDTYGHGAGDGVIDDTKILIRTLIDESEVPLQAGRIGGDEFGFIVYGDEEAAQKTAGELEARYQGYVGQPNNERLRKQGLGISIGYKTLTPDMKGASELMHGADKNLYVKKVEKLGELKRRQKLGLMAAKVAIKVSNVGSRPKVRMRDAPKLWRKMGILD